ncbi:uncharacterized protein LY89DRAFT_682023 [Mollisia scopiformis]|uniref:Gpi-anchored protein n=1 Tax=Mollisia scopiformis TaxID=149040 RepID=A0A194XJC8_MOLSC|nr:uncharacterized protein LY89DRAFT_682023 [Mollisia scopiformis]KUJ20263.1 hypothetical protein LY89DRAFT_682023 [Mollisia scopiformis]
MRSYIPLFLLPTLSALQIPSILAPFYEPHLEESLIISNVSLIPHELDDLRKRDGNCPDNYNSCSTLAAADAGACCTIGTFCTTDHAKNIACCPTGATCTGSITRETAATTTTSGGGGGGVFGTSSATTTTSTATTATITSAASLSYVSNTFFPWPYIPTTYINSAACMTAYSDCQSNLAACTADLEGGSSGFPVTIVAPGGGVTVGATAQNLGSASATSICSSLYQEGCYGIVPANCATFGTGTVTSFIVGTTGAAARPTMGCFATAGMMAGLGIGIAGQMI